jgi:hypothetical protein
MALGILELVCKVGLTSLVVVVLLQQILPFDDVPPVTIEASSAAKYSIRRAQDQTSDVTARSCEVIK